MSSTVNPADLKMLCEEADKKLKMLAGKVEQDSDSSEDSDGRRNAEIDIEKVLGDSGVPLQSNNSSFLTKLYNRIMSCELKTGVLYKLAGFFSEKPTVKTWNKRFFVLNKKTMRLQYWTVSEEQVFREEGTISSDPIGDISLVSPNLTIKAAHSEPSMFGTRYPIEISGDSSGKTLILAAADLRTRCDWMEAFIEGQTRHVTNQKVSIEVPIAKNMKLKFCQ
eukprot:sb/3469765/